MSDYATKDDVQSIVDKAVDKAVTDLSEVIAGFASQVDERFNKVEQDIGDLKTEVRELRHSHNQLLNTIDSFIARIDKNEVEQAARDNQFEKLLIWARKVSKKTGIPLENL